MRKGGEKHDLDEGELRGRGRGEAVMTQQRSSIRFRDESSERMRTCTRMLLRSRSWRQQH